MKHNLKKIFQIIFLMLAFTACSKEDNVVSDAAEKQKPKDNNPAVSARIGSRPVIQNGTLKTSSGQLIRGGPVVVWKGSSTETDWATSSSNIQRIRDDAKMNAVRLVAFDAWIFRNQPTNQYYTVNEAIAKYDLIVENADLLNMYVIINYHDVGGYSTSGEWSLNNFWTIVAPRYKDKSNVIYELVNEPVQWNASNYTNTNLDHFKAAYDIIRQNAPNTPILHLTFANANVSMTSIAQSYTTKTGINWSGGKDAIAFHPYSTTNTTYITELRNAGFPVFCSEWDFPNEPAVNQMNNQLYNGQTIEGLGISWLDWRSGRGDVDLNRSINNFLPDAVNKGYAWWTTNGSGSIANGTYSIKARHSGKGLDVAGASQSNGAAVQQWDYLGGANQQWKVESLGGGKYKILANHSNKTLDVPNASQSNGVQIQQWDYVGGTNQQWNIESLGGGYYKITASHSGKALEVSGQSQSNGGAVTQWDYWGGNNQQWSFTPVGSSSSTVTIRAKGFCGSESMSLQVNGTTVQTWNNLSTAYTNYTYSNYSGGNIKVVFTNNAVVNSCDRNLQVDYIIVGATTYQAENMPVNTGVWNGSACGGLQSEMLHCNGHIDFGG